MKILLALAALLLFAFRRPRRQSFANEAEPPPQDLFTFANQLPADAAGWVQLAPYGDFPNVDKAGKEVIQRFGKPDAEAIVNEFKSLANLPQRLLGAPWYVGHPDHTRFRGQPGHTDTAAKGRIKELEAREDGLYANVKWSAAGRQLVEDEAFHGHSVNWNAVPVGMEGGKQVFSPRGLKSVGFTNQPQIPVRPAALANEEVETKEPVEIAIGEKKFSVLLVNDDGGGLQESIAALTKELAGDQTRLFAARAEIGEARKDIDRLTTALANERQARATDLVSALVKAGKIKAGDREAKIAALAQSGDSYETLANALSAADPVVKTEAKTIGLGRQNTALQQDARNRQAKFEELLKKREEQFPNETYDTRFAAVAASAEGEQLFAQMQRAGAED